MNDEPTQVFPSPDPQPQPPSQPQGSPTHQPPPASPASRSRTPWVLAATGLVLALVLGGVAAWAYQREDSTLPGLRSDLDKARAELADAQAQLDTANADAGDTADQLAALQGQVASLKKKLKGSVATGKFPVVVYLRAGLGDQALFDDFQTQLVDPMVAWYDEQGIPPIVAVVIEIPENEGEPYSYVAVGLEGGSEEALFGERGEPIPTWDAPCDGDECEGLD